jgi:hypothetical protein
MTNDKIQAILAWPVPTSIKHIQQFLGLANYYRKFIPNFSKCTSPLTRLLRKDISFDWTPEVQLAFDSLKRAFTSAPVLRYFDPSLPITIETDASDFAMGAVLQQPSALDDKKLHPVAFWSRKFSPAEFNYEIYDKELLAIKAALYSTEDSASSGGDSDNVRS